MFPVRGSGAPYRMGWARFVSQSATARASRSRFIFSLEFFLKKNNKLIRFVSRRRARQIRGTLGTC